MSGPPVTAQSVRAAFPEWEVVLLGDGLWAARLKTAREDAPAPGIARATLRELVDALNSLVAGGRAEAGVRRG